MIGLAGRAEAARLCTNPLVLTGVGVAAALVWWNSRASVPQWWVWEVQIDSTMLVLAGTVLIAAQLAVGRVRRDHATALYDSYPTSARGRTAAHLVGLAGPIALAALLTVAAVIWLDLLGPVGTPRLAVLAQGLLLVALGGAIGTALGRFFPHPMAGILAVIVLGVAEADLLLQRSGPVQLPGGTAWLLPWTQPVVLRWLPGPTSMIPPVAHLPWLASLTALAALAALLKVGPRPRLIKWTALTMAGCLAVAGWSGWDQTRPDVGAQEGLAYRVTHPVQVERCTLLQRVRYCAYPGFGSDVPRWAAVVNGVLGRLPSPVSKPLVVRQVVDVDVYTTGLYGGYPPATAAQLSENSRLDAELSRFVNAESHDPHLILGSSTPPVYVDINWGAGSMTGAYQLGLAMQAARWVTGLPTTWQRSASYSCGPNCGGLVQIACLPLGQARGVIALWLAAMATPATLTAFVSQLGAGFEASKVGHNWISTYSGWTNHGYQAALPYTGQAAVLTEAMLRLPVQQVETVLAGRWPDWLSPRATDTQLAAALGIQMPHPPTPIESASTRAQPASPVCR